MALQDQLEVIETKMTTAEGAMRGAPVGTARIARAQLREMRVTHKTLLDQVEELYAALDVGEVFPDIEGYGLEFARVLVMAYDAKCIARQKVTGRFFEWDILDRAAGGKGHPLGLPLVQRSVVPADDRQPSRHRAAPADGSRHSTAPASAGQCSCALQRPLRPPARSAPGRRRLSTAGAAVNGSYYSQG